MTFAAKLLPPLESNTFPFTNDLRRENTSKYVPLSTIRFLHHSLVLVFSFVSFSYDCSFHSFRLPVFFIFFLPPPSLSFSLFCLPSVSPSSPNLDQFLSLLICLAHFLCLSLSLSVLLYFSLTSLVYNFCLSVRFSLSLYMLVFLSTFIYFVSLSLSLSMFSSLRSFNFSLPPRFIFFSVTFSLKSSASLPFRPLFSPLPKTKSLSIIIVCIFFKSFLRCLQ
ncbi:unnamed protein product [Acanthosepion pharaonis]|uniref:Uncharacterized protein n=1 Tax=Acanthosepion pharaonis TaxID=158019 RepID=A0A812EV55_ACAPH|nr:unnamed protein product [Sepia pharaonis]